MGNLFSGLAGFYRGITSNIASSAPISAVYTFTYESVKGALLPLFPKVICVCVCVCVWNSFLFFFGGGGWVGGVFGAHHICLIF